MTGWMMTGIFFDPKQRNDGGSWKAIFRNGALVAHVEIPRTNGRTTREEAEAAAYAMDWSW